MNHWTPEVFIHTPGNEIGLIEHFWPFSVQHVKVIPSKEIEFLVSVKHEVSRCSFYQHFTNSFFTKVFFAAFL